MFQGRLVLIHIKADAEARERAVSLDCVVNTGMATRKQRKGIGICGDPDSMIRAGQSEGVWWWEHSVHRNKPGSSQHK